MRVRKEEGHMSVRNAVHWKLRWAHRLLLGPGRHCAALVLAGAASTRPHVGELAGQLAHSARLLLQQKSDKTPGILSIPPN